jgi:hypothetical protein
MGKARVKEVLIEQGVYDGQIERIVHPRPDQEKVVCLGRRDIRTDVDHGKPAAFVQSTCQIIDFLHVDGLKDIPALEDYVA